MKNNIAPLAVVALFVMLIGVLLSSRQSEGLPESGLLFEVSNHQVNNLDHITLSNYEGQIATAELKDGKWWLKWQAQKRTLAYLADEVKIATLLNQVVKAKRVQAKTSKAEKYTRLGVESIDTQDSQGRLLVFKSQGDTWPELIVGNNANSGSGQYVRFVEQAQSWLMDQQLALPLNFQEWLQKQILSLDRSQLESLAYTSSDGHEFWTIAKQGERFALANQPEQRLLKYDGVLAATVDNVLQLELQDLRPKPEVMAPTSEPLFTLHVKTTKQQLIVLEVSKDQDQSHWLQVSSKDTAGAWSGWQYQLSDISVQQLNKSREDFYQPVENAGADHMPIEEGASPQ